MAEDTVLWRCPSCGGHSLYVVDSRTRKQWLIGRWRPYTRRRRACRDCSYRGTTVEVWLDDWNLVRALSDKLVAAYNASDALRELLATALELVVTDSPEKPDTLPDTPRSH